ncbi:hypothetical protein BGX27_007843 [Mortierella sp. AM989]|nr:hypothetical protein BGX27_007843 [Mortierella sp. AM989]
MRFYIVLIALSLYVWVASAGISGVEHQNSKVVTDEAPIGVAPDTATAPQENSPDIAAGGAILPAPAGPRTAAEETADSVLSCMDSCAGAAACQNDCVAKGYNVNLGAPVPVASASVPAPISTTAATAATAGITSTSGAIPTKTTTAHAASGASSQGLQMIGAAVAVGIAGLFAAL